jgi:hypothetical protein
VPVGQLGTDLAHGTVWAVGYDKNGTGRDPLIEYHQQG